MKILLEILFVVTWYFITGLFSARLFFIYIMKGYEPEYLDGTSFLFGLFWPITTIMLIIHNLHTVASKFITRPTKKQ